MEDGILAKEILLELLSKNVDELKKIIVLAKAQKESEQVLHVLELALKHKIESQGS